MDYDSNVYAIWEMYGSGMGFREQARTIRNCPYYNRLAFLPIADPSIFAQNQQQDNEVTSIAELFRRLPDEDSVVFVPGMKGGDVTAAERIKSELWANLVREEARWNIFANCPG